MEVMMNPIIGICPLYDDEKQSVWMLPQYQTMLEKEGACPFILPYTEDQKVLEKLLKFCDGILLTGGHDIDPALYHEDKSSKCGEINHIRDHMDLYLLKRAIELDKSVLGICRGVQLMNVYYGGTLYQDLPSEHKSNTEHHMHSPYDRTVHEVRIEEKSLLKEILGKDKIQVNSYHHQAIKELGALLKVAAVSEDNLIEAVYSDNHTFMLGVQWHPEFLYDVDENSKRIVKAFVQSCKS